MVEKAAGQRKERTGKVMIYRRGKNGTFWFRFRFAGRFVHESARTRSKAVARDAERQRRRELELKWNRIEKRELPPTLIEASKRWLEKRSALTTGTRETYKAALKHLCTVLGRILVCEIEAKDVLSYQRSRLGEGAAGATINKEIYCLSSILSEYGVWEQLRRDVKSVDENEEAGRALNRPEETQLLECASNIGRHQGNWTPLYTVTVLGLNTGMRHKEIRTLRWKNLDLANRILRVGESKTEAGRGRPIPLTQPAWASLEMWSSRFPDRKPDHFVFPASENGRIDPERPIANWRTAWRRACSDANLTGLRFHDLRHTAATKLLEQGTPYAVVAHILGWSASTAVRMAKRYGHIRPDVQRQALDAITTAEIQTGVNQIVHQQEIAVQSHRTN
jgi:integrase